ncbi:MAG: hypothetical protein ACO4CZ_11005 [Planctomycetota bacterium]
MIEIQNLRKAYRLGAREVVACSVRELRIASGEQVALLGRAGGG